MGQDAHTGFPMAVAFCYLLGTMFLLRLLALFYLAYCVAYFFRVLLAGKPGAQEPGHKDPFGARSGQRPPPPFDDFGPYGPFGPFGPFAQQRQQQQQYQQQYQYQQQQRPTARADEPSPYAILGVRPGATADEVRRAYQTKVREYHPDRTGNLPPELKELAEKRTKEITNAYNHLKRGR